MTCLRVLLVLAALGFAARAHASCPPPDVSLEGVRAATRLQVEQLGSGVTRLETSLAHVPGRTLGYEVQGLFRVTGLAAAALQRAFGRRDSYACSADAPRATFETPEGISIGLLFASHGSAVTVVLHLPEGQVELQLEGGVRVQAPLSQAGQRRWEEALLILSRTTRTTPREFYEQMTPPLRPPPAATDSGTPPPDTSRAPRDESHRPR